MFTTVRTLMLALIASAPGFAAAQEPEMQTSPWGAASKGLRCRATAPKAIEQGMRLEIELQFEVDVKSPELSAKRLNTFQLSRHMTLVLTHGKTGESLEVSPYDPSLGMPAVDAGNTFVLLDGKSLKPLVISFPLLRLRADLMPGTYQARVRFSFDRPHAWLGGPAKLQEAAFWKGTIESGVFPIEVQPEVARERTFFVPKQLRLEKGLEVKFLKEDAEQLSLPVRNGHSVAAKFFQGDVMYRMSGPPIPGDVNSIDQWRDYKGGDRKVTYTIEIFETSDPPVHLWRPRSGYKTLWKRTFTMEFSEKEIRARDIRK